MTEIATIDSIREGPERAAAARSTLYQYLASWLSFPWQDFHEFARSGEMIPAARSVIAHLPYSLEGVDRLWPELEKVDEDYDEFQSAYVGLFDVGMGGPPVPLYGGVWGGDRQRVMEEALRFYRYFGLTISSKERDLPDHLTAELEFLHFLTFKEVEALRNGEDPGSLRRAARDFLARHPARWLPKAVAKLAKIDAHPFWRAMIELADTYCRADMTYLISTEGPVKK